MTRITTPTPLALEGIGTLTVRQHDYVTQGGEGAIYRKGERILKLALDPSTFVRSGMAEKIRLLRARLFHTSIVTPAGLVYDQAGVPIGHHLPYVRGEPYPRLFTNDWRTQQGITDASVTALVSAMHEVVVHAHEAGALLVDANELNWLADVSDVRRPVPYAIDVDSWQIGRFKARAVMPSIQDWYSGTDAHGTFTPSEATDWFAWGVVTFLLYTGIHPYKGKLDGYKPGDLKRRMQENASVFLPEVRLSRAVRDFSVIPGPLLDWYRATFAEGERSVPPLPHATGTRRRAPIGPARTAVPDAVGLVHEEVLTVSDDPIVSVWPCGVVRTDSGALIEVAHKRVLGHTCRGRTAVAAHSGGYLVAEEVGTAWQCRFLGSDTTAHELSLAIPVREMVRSGDRMFAVTDTELIELTLQMFSRPVLTLGMRWQILGNSTKWYGGVGVSDVLGAMYLIVPDTHDSVAMVRVHELDGLRVVNATAFGRIAVVVVLLCSGQYRMYTFCGGREWRTYDVSVRDLDGPALNLTILPKGAIAEIREDGELAVTVPSQGTERVVSDKDIITAMQLGNIGDGVVYRYRGALWSLRMQQ